MNFSQVNVCRLLLRSSIEVARHKANRAMMIKFSIFFVVVFFFAVSFTFAISQEQAVSAMERNVSALAIIA